MPGQGQVAREDHESVTKDTTNLFLASPLPIVLTVTED